MAARMGSAKVAARSAGEGVGLCVGVLVGGTEVAVIVGVAVGGADVVLAGGIGVGWARGNLQATPIIIMQINSAHVNVSKIVLFIAVVPLFPNRCTTCCMSHPARSTSSGLICSRSRCRFFRGGGGAEERAHARASDYR